MWSDYQKAIFEEVKTGTSNVVIQARAGSGKTTTILEAIKYVPKFKRIVFCAFGKETQKELERRVPPRADARTLHSLGREIVMKAWGAVRVERTRAEGIIRTLLEENDINTKSREGFEQFRAGVSLLSLAKNCLVQNEDELYEMAAEREEAATFWPDLFPLVMEALEQCKTVSPEIDFDDMIWLPIVLNLPLLPYDVVFVDEVQDLNPCQIELAKRLCKEGGRIFSVGDDRQCIPDGQLVSTPKGPRPIETLQVGDFVLAAKGQDVVTARVLRTSQSAHQRILTFETDKGQKFRCTPNHVVYAALSPESRGYFIYLMWKQALGWRIGVTRSGYLVEGAGWMTRATIEKAERMWFVDFAASLSEARYKEASLSLRYQIPTITFWSRPDERINKEVRVKIFAEFGQNGERLLRDRRLLFELPAFLTKARATGNGKISININQAGRQGTLVSLWSSALPQDFEEKFQCIAGTKHGKRFGRLRAAFRSYKDAVIFANELHAALGETTSYISHRLSIGNEGGSVRPLNAAQLWPGMDVIVAVGPEHQIQRDRVKLRMEQAGQFTCRDLEIENLANYFVGGVCVHNSIYGFRGASTSNVQRLISELKAKVMPLPICYRCGQEIVKYAKRTVPDLEAWEGAPAGNVTFCDSHERASDGDFVLSRTNVGAFDTCLDFLARGKKAYMVGKDIGKSVRLLVERSKADTLSDLLDWLRVWYANERERIVERCERLQHSPERMLERIADQYATVRTLAAECDDLDALNTKLKILLTDDGKGIRCSTVHKAKGLEADRVWVLAGTFRRASKDDVEEENLWYVATTRAKQALYVVGKPRAESHWIRCAECEVDATIPFPPTKGVDYYCSACYRERS